MVVELLYLFFIFWWSLYSFFAPIIFWKSLHWISEGAYQMIPTHSVSFLCSGELTLQGAQQKQQQQQVQRLIYIYQGYNIRCHSISHNLITRLRLVFTKTCLTICSHNFPFFFYSMIL